MRPSRTAVHASAININNALMKVPDRSAEGSASAFLAAGRANHPAHTERMLDILRAIGRSVRGGP